MIAGAVVLGVGAGPGLTLVGPLTFVELELFDPDIDKAAHKNINFQSI